MFYELLIQPKMPVSSRSLLRMLSDDTYLELQNQHHPYHITPYTLGHRASRQLMSWSLAQIASGFDSWRFPYSWKQAPPRLYTIFLTILTLVGIDWIPYTTRPLSISYEKSLPFILYSSFVILNFLSPAIKFFQIPFANFFMYLFEALSGVVPFCFLSFRSAYRAFLTISGKAASNSGSSSMVSAQRMQIRSNLTLSSASGASLSNVRISRFSYFEIIPLLQISSSASQNQFSLLFLA